ncbi:MAG: phosphatidate cytidylyltransferase [Candidatus Caenarcaniphilales bacterium]|nr:phosphatidate cytidylyltransferase [Candidatus Caenarcaniphilales bacterium]
MNLSTSLSEIISGGFTNLVKMIDAASALNKVATIVFFILVSSTIVVFLLTKLKKDIDFSELAQRVRSWWVMAVVFFLLLFINPKLSIVIFGFVSFLALKEFYTLIHSRMSDLHILLWAYLVVPIQYYWILSDWKAMFFIFIPVYIFLFIPIRNVITNSPNDMVESMAKVQWGLMAFVYCISHIAALMMLKPNGSLPEGGLALLLYLVFLTEINDVLQYISGKLPGKRIFGDIMFLPSISPKKTIEGLIGGIIGTALVACSLKSLIGGNIVFALLSGIMISVIGTIGDLVMSAVKRDVGVKDSSSLIPGHGGIIDRIDSLVYTAPIFFHLVSFFFYQAPPGCSIL